MVGVDVDVGVSEQDHELFALESSSQTENSTWAAISG